MTIALSDLASFVARLRERAAAMENEGYPTTARYLEEAAWRLEELRKAIEQ